MGEALNELIVLVLTRARSRTEPGPDLKKRFQAAIFSLDDGREVAVFNAVRTVLDAEGLSSEDIENERALDAFVTRVVQRLRS